MLQAIIMGDDKHQPRPTQPQAVNQTVQYTKALQDNLVKQILVNGHYLTAETLRSAEHAATLAQMTFLDYVLDQNIITPELLGQAIAASYQVPYADLQLYQPSKDRIGLIPPEVGQSLRVIAFKIDDTSVTVATDNPQASGLVQVLSEVFPNKTVHLAYALPDDIDSLLVYYRKPLATRFNQIIQEQSRVAPEIIDEIIKDAVAFKVSDIHFEPQEAIVLIRFRVDGVLHEAGQLPKQYYDNILNRIKVQSHMRIDEHNASQDGAIRYEIDGEPLSIRISIVPTLDGEKVAMRILAEYSRNLSLKNLGLSPDDKNIFNAQAKRPFGMIMTTGPTGSGKTTTLYALLKMINNPELNITTIEDPVEYKIVGVNQIQVNQATGLGFTQGLRTLLRQDPDVILVGEIRDGDTAKLAVNAALTGHLLFSTFHANDAATAIPRLLDMDVEPFLVASTLNAVIAQRLVRMIHSACRESFEVSIDELKRYLPQAEDYFRGPKVTLYRGRGCEGCNFTGYRGRTAIFEIIVMTPELKELVLKNPTMTQIWDLAKQQGAHSLFEDGIDKVQSGITTLEELRRVAEPK